MESFVVQFASFLSKNNLIVDISWIIFLKIQQFVFSSEHTQTAVSVVGILFNKKQILEPEQVKFEFSIVLEYF